MTKLAIVILNWNGIDFLKRFVPSVIQHSAGDQTEIWIADNGSEDGSAVFLKKEFAGLRILELDCNYGFAGGYNRALSQIEAEYYILLNSDIEVTNGWTGPMLRLLESDQAVAACMPKIMDLNFRDHFEYAGAAGGFIDFLGYPFCRGRIFESIEKDTGQYDDENEVFWASGACLMIRAGDWHAAGGFDESFFAHMEEIDLCWRLKNSGKKIMACPSSVVFHLGGGTLPRYHPKKTFLNFRNSLLMLVRNLPGGKLYLVPVRLFFDWLSVVKFMTTFSFGNMMAVLKAHLDFFRLLPRCFKIRKKLLSAGRNVNNYGIYHRSIVFDFFLAGKRYFTSLKFKG